MQNQPKSSDSEWTIIKLLKWATPYFKSRHIESPRATAEILLAHVLDLKRIDLYLRFDQPLSVSELTNFKALIKRRIKREPIAYILGVKEFWSMDFEVTRDVLIPRPETEFLVEVALGLLPEDSDAVPAVTPRRILELGTGSGAAILALATMRPDHLFFASDRSIRAVGLARQNATRHRLERRVRFFCANWFEPFNDKRSRFDMIISNPPYVPSREIERLQPEIKQHEPIQALDGGKNGLSCLKHIIGTAHFFLRQEGSLLLEIGHDQKEDVCKMIEQSGNFENIVFTKDYSGYDRIVRMQKKG